MVLEKQGQAHAGVLANSVLSGIGNGVGGATGLAGFVIAELFQTDSNLFISGVIYENPEKYKGFFGERIRSKNDKDYGASANIFYML